MAKKKMDHSLYMTAGIACVAIVVIVLIVLGIGGNLGFGTGDLVGQAGGMLPGANKGGTVDTITKIELDEALDELRDEIMAEMDLIPGKLKIEEIGTSWSASPDENCDDVCKAHTTHGNCLFGYTIDTINEIEKIIACDKVVSMTNCVCALITSE